MIELLHENHRYCVRRWGIYEEVESEPITGMNVDRQGRRILYPCYPQYVSYRFASGEQEAYVPAAASEIRKLPSVDQNPGWED